MKVAILDILLHKTRQVDLRRTVCGRGNRNIRDEILQNAARHNILTYIISTSNQRHRNQYVIYSTVRKINRYKPSALRLPMLIRHCKGTPLIRTSKPPNLPKQRFPRPHLSFPEGNILSHLRHRVHLAQLLKPFVSSFRYQNQEQKLFGQPQERLFFHLP